jgi:hypothetical protein
MAQSTSPLHEHSFTFTLCTLQSTNKSSSSNPSLRCTRSVRASRPASANQVKGLLQPLLCRWQLHLHRWPTDLTTFTAADISSWQHFFRLHFEAYERDSRANGVDHALRLLLAQSWKENWALASVPATLLPSKAVPKEQLDNSSCLVNTTVNYLDTLSTAWTAEGQVQAGLISRDVHIVELDWQGLYSNHRRNNVRIGHLRRVNEKQGR